MSIMCKRAVVLAGGKGQRLRPYTVALPKPLMPLGEYPILEIIVRQLSYRGFGHITMAVNHQADIIRAYFGDGSKWNVRIDYSLETKPLGTIAPLSLIEDLPEDFLLINGDVLTDLDFLQLYNGHVTGHRPFTIASSRRQNIVDYGVLQVDGSGTLTGFSEKPTMDYLVSMGVYVVNRKLLTFIPKDQKFGFDDLMVACLDRGHAVHVEVHNGYWLDIGRPDDYMVAVDEFEKRKSQLLMERDE